MPSNSAFFINLRTAEALVVNNRGIFSVGTILNKVRGNFETNSKEYAEMHSVIA